jgi:TorA maturation chaperone TorD
MSGEQRTASSGLHDQACGIMPDASAHARGTDAVVAPPLGGEDQARADFYALFAHLLLAPPNDALLAALAAAEPIAAAGEFALEDAWLKLAQAASVVDAGLVADEFAAMFISTGTPPLNPYGSFYLTGHLNDVPLADLRHDLARLRLARAPGVGESEDHLGALCETMRVLIQGGPGMPARGLAVQKTFFEAHIRPWYAACLADIMASPDANFYRIVAGVVDAFLSIEAQAFAVLDATDPLAA